MSQVGPPLRRGSRHVLEERRTIQSKPTRHRISRGVRGEEKQEGATEEGPARSGWNGSERNPKERELAIRSD